MPNNGDATATVLYSYIREGFLLISRIPAAIEKRFEELAKRAGRIMRDYRGCTETDLYE